MFKRIEKKLVESLVFRDEFRKEIIDMIDKTQKESSLLLITCSPDIQRAEVNGHINAYHKKALLHVIRELAKSLEAKYDG